MVPVNHSETTVYVNKWMADGGSQFSTVGVEVCRQAREKGWNELCNAALELEISV